MTMLDHIQTFTAGCKKWYPSLSSFDHKQNQNNQQIKM